MDYKLKKDVLMSDLFDGRLEKYGIFEDFASYLDFPLERVLRCGGEEILLYVSARSGGPWLWKIERKGGVSATWIFKALAAEFNTDIFSDNEPQFWGYETMEEMEEDMYGLNHANFPNYFE